MQTALRGALLAAAVVLAGCGTTQIVTSEPRARIWADGELVGLGRGEIRQRGTPGSAAVVVKAEDGRQAREVIHRRFTATTLIAGLFTYGICLIACWEYPDTVFVFLPEATASASGGFEAPAAGDPWLRPPAGWQPKHPSAPPPSSVPPPASPPPPPPPPSPPPAAYAPPPDNPAAPPPVAPDAPPTAPAP